MKKQLLVILGLMSFAGTALAEPVAVGPDWMSSGAVSQGLMLGAFALIFYFLILRPQSKRAKDHRDLVTGLQKGDEIITSGGMLGKISRVADNFFIVSIAEGTEVMIQKQAVATTLPKGTMKAI